MKNWSWSLKSCERLCRADWSLPKWVRRNIIENFNRQQHRCENLKIRKKSSHFKLNLWISKPITKKAVIFQYLALALKTAVRLNCAFCYEKLKTICSVELSSYSVAVSNALFSLVKIPLAFQDEGVSDIAQHGLIWITNAPVVKSELITYQ
jgi:hypothetical protein